MPTLASPSARSDAIARTAASSSGTTSAAGAALDAVAGAGWTSLEKSATAHPNANRNPVRRMAGGISKPFSRLRRAGWEAAVLALLLAGCGRSAGERQTGWKAATAPSRCSSRTTPRRSTPATSPTPSACARPASSTPGSYDSIPTRWRRCRTWRAAGDGSTGSRSRWTCATTSASTRALRCARATSWRRSAPSPRPRWRRGTRAWSTRSQK